MVEIRSYEGAAEDLREFVVGVWRNSYGGRMAFPLWSADYFRWQLGVESAAPRDHLLAAYDGTRLVGTILGFPARFRTERGEVGGSQGSWLSIDPAYRRQGIATQLRQELRRRHAELGLAFQVGYGYFGSPHSLGPSFWESQRALGTTFLTRAGFWVRVLQARRAANWNLNRAESLLTRTFGWLALPPRERSTRVAFRPFQPEDAPLCRELLEAATAACSFSLVWDEPTLRRHLAGGGVGRTLVAVKEGRPAGFVNWHCLPFLGRTEETLAVIDLLALGGLGRVEQFQTVRAALAWMREEGAVLALKLRIGDYPVGPLMAAEFVPRLPDSYIMVTWAGEPQPIRKPSRLHLLWR